MAIKIAPAPEKITENPKADATGRSTKKRAGRKPSGKVVVSLRVEPDVIERWRATGAGYQSRIADLLKRHAP